MIYIVPHYALDDEIRGYLARNFDQLRAFNAPERQFKQCIVIGRRIRSGHAAKSVLDMLSRAQASEQGAEMLPERWMDAPYVVPAVQSEQEFDFHAVRMDAAQLADELGEVPIQPAVGPARTALRASQGRVPATPCVK